MKRLRVPEAMDDPNLESRAHDHALRSLALVNRLLLVNHCMRRQLLYLCPRVSSVLELGCGGGSMLKALTTSINLQDGRFTGLDFSEFALQAARRSVACGTWIAADARRLPLRDRSYDAVICSLLLHHFDPQDVVAVLNEAARVARRVVLVADLTRSLIAWLSTCVVTRLLSRSWVFHVDALRSVRAAFTVSEMEAMARQSGLDGAVVRGRFPFRMILAYVKPGGESVEHAF